MKQVKEFCNEVSVEDQVNNWLSANPDIKIIDIKYSANEYSSNILVVYEE